MQFYSPIQNNQPKQLNNHNTYKPAQDLDAYLSEQALKFARQHLINPQPEKTRLQVGAQPRARTFQDLNIRPLYSDEAPITPIRQYNYGNLNQQPDNLDLYLTKQAEEFARKALKAHSEGSALYNVLPQAQYGSPYINNQMGAEANQFIQQPVQYYIPQPQPQPQQIRQVRQVRQVQRVQQGQPEVIQNFVYNPKRNLNVANDRTQPNGLVLPSPVIQQEPYLGQQARQVQVASTNAEAVLEKKMEFMKKGPRGEALYKIQEGGMNYYVKTGLTPEAVCNYSLAHIIGVGPPVEIIGSDGIKMEEGVCVRQAIKDKLITFDEAFKQVRALHKTLYDSGMAHCDVKFENCLYFPRHGKVLLIDNGDIAPYGNQRTIKTAGANSTLIIAPTGNEERNRVGPATDLRGFMHIMMNALEEH